MTIPADFQASNYPESMDTDQNLFLVRDALRVTLAIDYNPAIDSSKVVINGDNTNFPSNGIITLTEQCSDILERAISFYYTSKTATTFEGLTPLDGFDNTIIRPKKATNVTQNVVSAHHNNIKDAIIAIQNFVGIKGEIDTAPFGDTMEGRINFLRKLALTPKAWFTADKQIGLVPLEVTFTNESFNLGDGEIIVTWDFGDANSTIPTENLSTISVTSIVPISSTDVRVVDLDSKTVLKTYSRPGNYNAKLTIENQYGTDVVEFENFINARIEAPIEAIIEFIYTSDQIFTNGSPVGGPYDSGDTPKIRSRINKFIDIQIPDGIHPTTLRTYAGEEVEGSTPIDPIESFTWVLNDDLPHANQNYTRASYSIGGSYDLVLRCDTRFGSYRITTYESALDIVEDRNMWLFTINGITATPNEFGLISETFKTGDTSYTLLRDPSFLNDTNNYTQALKEFNRNVFFGSTSVITSGNNGESVITYSSGGSEGSPLSTQLARVVTFQGFSGLLSDDPVEIYRPWNWIYFSMEDRGYYLLGLSPDSVSDSSSNYIIKDTLSYGVELNLQTPTELINPLNFINGAEEILENINSGFDEFGEPLNGRFSVYRAATRGNTGYFLRNDGVGNFFKIRDFYRTEGTSDDPLVNIRKMADMAGSVKPEGQLINLNSGLFFFNNSGNIAAFNVVDGIWETGTATSPFRTFQDDSVVDFDNRANSLLATSDNERIAYLTYDYSNKAFVKYNSVDQTFSSLGLRPEGDQWVAGIY